MSELLSIRQVAVHFIPGDGIMLEYSSAAAAIFMRSEHADVQLSRAIKDICSRGWISPHVTLDKEYDIDREGTEYERRVFEALSVGGPLCDLYVNPHKSIGLAGNFTLKDFADYTSKIVTDGASVVLERRKPKTFKLELEDVVPLIAWPDRAIPAWASSAARRSAHTLRSTHLKIFLEQEVSMKRSLVIDVVPGSWTTWHPEHLLHSILKRGM
jgi:hypothetical protein